MSVISMMEMNAKGLLWDWDNLVLLNTKSVEAPKKLQFLDAEIEGIEGFEVGSFYSSGGRSDGGTGSDLGYASSSRSSKSASVDSFTDREMKGTKFTVETNEGSQQDLRSKIELVNSGVTRTSPTIESPTISGESLIALELGKRTYFEDVSAVSNAKNATMMGSLPPCSGVKKSKSSSLNVENPRCQVEGCNLDLSSAKDYHRKHRVCEDHSKSSKVVINGLERRFCQQCSRFHSLAEFDQKKRSCRRRLSDHNARRRKPKPEVIQFNSMRMASSLYEGRNQLSFAFNQGSGVQTRHDTWNSPNSSSKGVSQPKPGCFTTMKTGTTDEMHTTDNTLQNPEAKLSPVSTHFLPSKGTSSEAFHQGLPAPIAHSNIDTTQDLRALSLLSTSSWGSCNPEPSPLHHSIHTNQASLSQSLPDMHGVSLNTPPVSSDFWQAEQPMSSGPGSSTFHLFKPPNAHGSNFYLY